MFRNSLSHSALLVALLTAASTFADQEIRLYVESGIHHSARSVAFSPDGRYIATGSLDRTIKLWDAATTRELLKLQNGAMPYFLAFVGDSGLLASSNEDGRVTIWDVSRGRLLHSLVCSNGRASIAVKDHGNTLLCVGEQAGLIHRWNTVTFEELPPIQVRATDLLGGKFLDGEGSQLLGQTGKEESRIIDVVSWAESGALQGPLATSIESVGFSRERGLIVTAGKAVAVWAWNADTGGKAKLERLLDLKNIHSVALSKDSNVLAAAEESGDVVVLSTSNWQEVARLSSLSNRVEQSGILGDSSILATQVWYDNKFYLDLTKGVLVERSADQTLDASHDNWSTKGFVNGRLLSIVNRGDSVRIETDNGSEVCTIVYLDKQRQWIVASPDGRFDTNMDLGAVRGAHWVLGNEYFAPLPLEIFMRDYFQPKLLPRLLSSGGASFQPLQSLESLNRVQPPVTKPIVRFEPTSGDALVTVGTGSNEDKSQKNDKTKTLSYDLRLFRNGQLVGQWPEPKAGLGGPLNKEAWREASRVPMEAGQTKAEHTFRVALPSHDRGKPVVFTAYAFNEDRVKSETAKNEEFKVPEDMPLRKSRAYVITVGVDGYDLEERDLNFAAKDARALSAALSQIKDHEVVRLNVVSNKGQGGKPAIWQATKANIRAVFELLAGKSEAERARLKSVAGIDKIAVDQLRKASPDDVVIIAFSGHGYTDPSSGQFYLLPSDSGKEPGFGPAVLSKFIASEELSQWLRDVDAGQMAMIIDACHSAASVDAPGFKPGPMGDRGLGQLAYDKGMMILAATQASDVALEVQKIQHGLLTYALVADGFEEGVSEPKRRNADLDKNGTLTLTEWLQYGERRVPILYEDIRTGKLKVVGRDPTPADQNWRDHLANKVQTPLLFDFQRNRNQFVEFLLQ